MPTTMKPRSSVSKTAPPSNPGPATAKTATARTAAQSAAQPATAPHATESAFRLAPVDMVMGRQAMDARIGKAGLRLMRPSIHQNLKVLLADKKSPLQRLIDNPPRLDGAASKLLDGRKTKIVLASVHDAAGRTRAGIPVQLRSDQRVLDRSVTNREGAVVLLVPDNADVRELDVAVTQGAKDVAGVVNFSEGNHAVVDIIISHLSEEDGPISRAADPFDRLPADFSPHLCAILPQYLGMRGHQLLQNPLDPEDFRSHRNRLIKRFTVPRIGDVPTDGSAPRRYLVTVRQDWYFLGYTLGELQQVEGLDPGQIIDETLSQATRTVQRTARTATDSLRRTITQVQDTLSRVSSVDTVVDVATQAHTQLDVNGYARASTSVNTPGLFGGLAAGLFGGSLGGASVGTEFGTSTTTDAWASALTRTSMDSSLYVNNLMRSAQSQVNKTVRTAVSMLRDVQTQLTRTVGQVSPLLSKVTNMLRWSVYENYAVCTHVEDVVEVQSVEVTDVSKDGVLFPAEDIVEYRRYFQPALLEPRLHAHFDTLARAVARERSADMPVQSIDVVIDYTAQIAGAEVRCRLPGAEERTRLEPGGNQAAFTIDLPQALPPTALPDMKFELFMDDVASSSVLPELLAAFGAQITQQGTVRIHRVRLRYRSSQQDGGAAQDAYLGNQLRTHGSDQYAQYTLDLEVPRPADTTEYNPLFIHVNRNRTYYLGLLMQAALRHPSLRDDAWQLADFDAEHSIWRLPILGFEGDRVLVIGNVDPADKFVQGLLTDPGAGSLVQIAAPGAYSEALEGLLTLTDAAGRIHPNLEPPVPAQVPSVAVIDVAKQLVDGHNNHTLPELNTP